ncbi:CwfJ C-terminus 2-domain-containing protein-like protein [Paraphysoderma sedebokerense]|nr:CwfJ C-terminus 2-domain-containing protein-like protein [Paraphysoderma sedebokerense]
MKKLERVFEIAEEEGRDVEEVGAERFGSLEEFKAVLAERDASLQSKPEEDSTPTDEQRVPPSTSTFLSLKNRLASSHTAFAKPVSEQPPVESSPQLIEVHHSQSSSSSKPTIAPATIPAASIPSSTAKTSKPVMTQTQLNQLQAKVLKAKLMNAPNAEQLEQQYELEKSRFESSGETTEDVVVLPSIDMHGKVILSSMLPSSTSQSSQPKKEEDLTIEEMVKLEKLQNLKMGSGNVSLGGARGSGTGDDEFARKVMGDKRFQSDLDYLDDHADQLSGAVDSGKKSKAEKRGKTFEIKQKERDIKDYLKQQEAIAKCPYCWKDASTSGSSGGSATTSTTKIPPSVPVISIGNKVYLALDPTNSVTECLIIPVQHMTSTLDGDDEVWDEIRNFMKCLLKKYDSENKSVIFMETILNLKWQKHTVIEVIPVPYEVKEDAPAYFREALLDSDSHWTQHQPIIDTQKKGFRRSMVPNLPYFHVWFDLDGGYGHVVEENEKWKEWFGKEIIAGVLDLGPDKYRRCRRLDKHVNHERVREFVKGWKKWDWTVMLDGGGY